MLSAFSRRAIIPGTRAFRSSTPAAQKVTTNLVGLEVVPNAPEVLTELYTKILEEVKILPASAEYRINVEKLSKYRLKVVSEKAEIDAIESEVGLQVEEMIVEVQKELKLIPQMAEWKPWEATAATPEQH